jgi:3'-phosphoadenosine 5'-phosphosulfate sulfotransferase (PAPS reductase)/FAD synthetase
MDTSDEDIVFDEHGVCNHCKDFEAILQQPRFDKEHAEKNLAAMLEHIKARGKGKKYDCVMGISGGVDSCYAVYLCHSWGLRPLVMHMDNGWNSEIAVQNIKNLVNKLYNVLSPFFFKSKVANSLNLATLNIFFIIA